MSPALTPKLHALLTLHLVPGLGPRLTAALLERFGSAEAVLRATPAELRQVPYLGDTLSQQIAKALSSVDVQPELDLLERHDVTLRVLGEADYPTGLATIADPPHLLYVKGTLLPSDANAVAIVGSRQYTAYGRRVAERLAGGLARAGFTVVSGLARGIDGAAHKAALDAGGRTTAVLAGGLSKIYPPEHADLAKAVESAGALISESHMGQEPMAGLFPARNRLISGLSRGVVVVEAAAQSGTLTTARHAFEQGREVFAVPGPVDSASSAGTIALLREGARAIRDVDDLLADLKGIAPPKPAVAPDGAVLPEPAPVVPAGLDGMQTRIFEYLGTQPRHADEIARALEIPIAQLSGTLMLLEMKKVIRRLPGNHYERRT